MTPGAARPSRCSLRARARPCGLLGQAARPGRATAERRRRRRRRPPSARAAPASADAAGDLHREARRHAVQHRARPWARLQGTRRLEPDHRSVPDAGPARCCGSAARPAQEARRGEPGRAGTPHRGATAGRGEPGDRGDPRRPARRCGRAQDRAAGARAPLLGREPGAGAARGCAAGGERAQTRGAATGRRGQARASAGAKPEAPRLRRDPTPTAATRTRRLGVAGGREDRRRHSRARATRVWTSPARPAIRCMPPRPGESSTAAKACAATASSSSSSTTRPICRPMRTTGRSW